MKTIRLVTGMVMILLLIVSMGGCGGTQPDPEPAKPSTPAPPPAPTRPAEADPAGPRQGGTVVMGIWSEPGNLNPLLTSSGYEMIIHEVIYNSLIRANEMMEPGPDLAES